MNVPAAGHHVDHDLRLLLAGLLVSIALIVVGAALAIGQGGRLPTEVVALQDLWRQLAVCDPAALISTGFLTLIATPALRLALAAGRFWHDGDRRFAVVALVVSLILLAGLFIGHR